MQTLSAIIVAAMAVPFIFIVTLIVASWIYNRRTTIKQKRIHAKYFKQ